MMEPVIRIDETGASAEQGRVRFDGAKSSWIIVMIVGSLTALFNVSWSAIILFLGLTYLTLLFGHSIGMHRMMIHRTFKASRLLQRSLIFIGVLVGMGGPFSIIKIHDIRDWAQRQPACHDFFSHKRSYFTDIYWQLFCRFDFEVPLQVHIEQDLYDDPYIQFFESHWRLIQLVFAGILFLAGGLPWVLWGVCCRVLISIWGHWSITYICHNPGPGKWDVRGAGVQASNLKALGFVSGVLSQGECWHNNHHAFPESAQIGLEVGQLDPAWSIIRQLEKWGLIYDVKRPRPITEREDLALRL